MGSLQRGSEGDFGSGSEEFVHDPASRHVSWSWQGQILTTTDAPLLPYLLEYVEEKCGRGIWYKTSLSSVLAVRRSFSASLFIIADPLN